MPGMPEPFWIYANVSSMRHTIVGESEMYAFSHEAKDYILPRPERGLH